MVWCSRAKRSALTAWRGCLWLLVYTAAGCHHLLPSHVCSVTSHGKHQSVYVIFSQDNTLSWLKMTYIIIYILNYKSRSRGKKENVLRRHTSLFRIYHTQNYMKHRKTWKKYMYIFLCGILECSTAHCFVFQGGRCYVVLYRAVVRLNRGTFDYFWLFMATKLNLLGWIKLRGVIVRSCLLIFISQNFWIIVPSKHKHSLT